MTKTKQDFITYAGDTVNISIGVSGSDGNAASLSNASVVWVLEESVASGSLVKKTTGSTGGASVSGSLISIALTPSDTTSLAGDYYHEAEVTDTNSDVSTVTTGIATIKKSGA